MRHSQDALTQEIARIICEELVIDYGQAKRKAAARLGGYTGPGPENIEIQLAVLDYQRLFGGERYSARLRQMRLTALEALRFLSPFQPRLVGATISGAVTAAHRVQLHAFFEKPEQLDIFLQDCGIRFEQDEREYRYPNGRNERVSIARFEADGVGVDVAAFDEDDFRRAPLNPSDGQLFRRLDLKAAEALLES